MIDVIKYLVENPNVLSLLKENKISLLNITPIEQQAIVEAFQNTISILDIGWR